MSFCQLAEQTVARPDRTPLFTFDTQFKRDVAGKYDIQVFLGCQRLQQNITSINVDIDIKTSVFESKVTPLCDEMQM